MEIAKLVAERSTCARAKVGAVAVKNNYIIMTGYNGSLPGQKHCTEIGCDVHNGHCIRTVHSEANVISHCAKNGIALEGATLYCTHRPCYHCMKLIISAGIKRVFYDKGYIDEHNTKTSHFLVEVIKHDE